MKKLFVSCAFALLSNYAFSQAHTDSSLSLMTKMQLADVYINEVTTLALNTPYTSFTMEKPGKELDVPTSKYLNKKRGSILETSQKYGSTMKEKLYEIIPYSDKEDMIRAILFLQKTNNKIKNNEQN